MPSTHRARVRWGPSAGPAARARRAYSRVCGRWPQQHQKKPIRPTISWAAAVSWASRWSRAAQRSACASAMRWYQLIWSSPVQPHVGVAGQAEEAGGVPVGGGPFLAEFGEPHPSVLADGVEHAVPYAVPAHDGLGHQALQRPGHTVRGERSPGADLAGHGLVEVAAQDRQPGPQQPFQRGAQLVAPADGGAQGAVARRPDRGVGGHVEAGPDPGGDLLDGVPAEGPGREFDSERNAFDAAADLGGGLRVPRLVEGQLRGRHGCPVPEQRQRVGRALDGQRLHLDYLFALDVQGLAAGGEHGEAGRCREDLAEQVGAGGAQMLARVEDQQHLLVDEPFAQGVDGHAQGVVGEPDGVGDGRDEQSVVVQRRQIGPPRAVAVSGRRLPGGADREPGLADATAAGERGQPVRGEGVFEPGKFGFPSDKARCLLGDVARHGHRR